jgi:imidazole glycerol-phosphate synthase subunit HisH
MKKNICIIDYGVGNLLSIERSIQKLGYTAKVSNNKKTILDSSHLILPGVGAFGKAMETIRELNLDETLKEYVKKGRFIMGICLGMQLLCSESEEFEINKGLNLIPGKIISLKDIINKKNIKIPNIGWSNLLRKNIEIKNQFYDDINEKDTFYFIHSFVAKTDEKYQSFNSLYYEVEFQAVINKNNIYGVQFHPEKSGRSGLKIINNFLNLC